MMASKDDTPDISLIIPAWNEAAYLPRLLDSVDVARGQYQGGAARVEVIVADNDSTDETPRIAAARGCRVQHVAKRLIAAARNGGAAIARGQLLAFADADFRIHPETFNYVHAVMQKPGFIGGGTGLVMERWSLGIAATWYLVMPPLWLLHLDGGVWFCRRRDFQEVGGFDESRVVGEDVAFLSALKRLGRRRRPKETLATHFTARRIGLKPALALNSARKWDRHGDWHMLTDLIRGLPALCFSREAFKKYVAHYWYEDR
jgi:glycosyltransferase involved in cell wall biosynthesis